MQRMNKKVVGLLASVLCAVCVLAQPLMGVFAYTTDPEYLGTVVNGWVATCRRAGGHPNDKDKVKLEAVDENTTRITPYDEDDGYAVAGRFDENGDLVESTLKPSADGRFAFTVKVSSVGLDADEVYVPFGTEINGHWHRNCEITKDGLRIRLVRSGSNVKLYVDRPVVEQDGQMLAGVRYDTLKEGGIDFALDTAHRFVFATKTADGKNVTSVYVDDVLFGSVETTESYFVAKKGENTTVMLGVGGKDTDNSGSAVCTVEVGVNAADRTEELTALIAACEALQNDKAIAAQKQIFAAAIAEAKTALDSGDENAMAAALQKLNTEKTKFAGADANANGWAAVKSASATADETANVLLYALGETITEIHAPNFARGAAILRQGLAPIRAGKFAIDFTLKAQELAGNGHAFYLPIVWDTYCDTANPDVSTANNGVILCFTKTDDGLKLGLVNGEKSGDERNFQNGWPVIDTSKTLHIVVETIDGTTSVYINGVCYGQTTFTDNSSYLWNGNKATLALGGGATWNDAEGGKIVAVIDTHAPDSTETLQALIDACESTENANATDAEKATFTAAIDKAKADLLKDELTVLQAIEDLTAAKLAFVSCGEVPERIELRKLIADCEKLAANTVAADEPTYEQTTTAAKAAFTAAIGEAKSKAEGTTLDELKAALEALKAAKAEFEASILHDTGWRAQWVRDWEGIEDHTDEVGIRYISDGVTELYVGDTMTAGADLRFGLKPVKGGKWEFDVTVLTDGTTSTWCDLDWAWLVYNSNPDNNEFTYPSVTTNGLQIKLDQLGTGTSPKFSIYNRDVGETYGSADGQPMDMAYGVPYHVVFETLHADSGEPIASDEEWEPFKFVTVLYVNDRIMGVYDTPNLSPYWKEDAVMSLGAGGDGWTRMIVDIKPETNEEKLQALIAACEELLDSKTASDTPSLGEVSTEDAEVFRTVIDAAKTAQNGTEAELIVALALLDAARDGFNDAVVGRVDTLALREAIAEAEAVRDVLSEDAAAYKPLADLIDEADALLADDTAEQTAIDDKAAALLEAVDTARAENMIFAVDRLDQFDPTGLEVKANGQFIRFATNNKDGKLYSKDWFDVYTTLNGTKKLVFDITDLGRIDGQYSRVMFEDPTGEHRLYAEILTMEGEGTIRICQPQEDQEDPTVLIPLAAAEYKPGKSSQVVIEATADGRLIISIDGEKLYEETTDLAAIFNGTDDITVSLLSGGDLMDEQSMTVDFAAKERPAADDGKKDPENPDNDDNGKGDSPVTGYATHTAAALLTLGLTAGAAALLAKKHRGEKA